MDIDKLNEQEKQELRVGKIVKSTLEGMPGYSGLANDDVGKMFNDVSEIWNRDANGGAPLRNLFIEALINKVGMTLVKKGDFINPFERFKRRGMTIGGYLEEIWSGVPQNKKYNPNASAQSNFDRYDVDVKEYLHEINFREEFPLSIGEAVTREAFNNYNSFDEFINNMKTSIQDAVYDYDFVSIKEGLVEYFNKNEDKINKIYINPVKSYATAEEALLPLNTTSKKYTVQNSNYNVAGVRRATKRGMMTLVMDFDLSTGIDIFKLAQSYNLNKADIEERVIEIDEFPVTASGEKIVAMLFDDNFVIHQPTTEVMNSQMNAQGLFTNIFFHYHGILTFSDLQNVTYVIEKPQDDAENPEEPETGGTEELQRMENDEKPKEEPTDITKMSKAELQKLAQDKNIEFTDVTSKKDLINLLK